MAGYALSLHEPSSIQTALALRQAIWRKGDPRWSVCGIPETFYNDHGSDFTSKHLEQVAAELHMSVVFSTAGKPRGRGKIECFFSTVNQLFLSEQPGYSPAGAPAARPELTLPALDTRLRQFLVEVYNRRPHSETGESPQARWETAALLPRLPEAAEQLDLLLLTVAKPRRVHQDGIHFQGSVIWIPRWRRMWARTSSFATTHVTWPNCGFTFTTSSCVGRSTLSWLAKRSPSRTAFLRNQRRRELQTTLTERRAIIETLLGLRAGAQQELPTEPEPAPPAAESGRPRLKRYYNE